MIIGDSSAVRDTPSRASSVLLTVACGPLNDQFSAGVLDSVGPALAGVPVLAPALPLLTGLGGLFLRRPGDVTKDDLRKQKEASYNAGLSVGKELLA